ncbi:MAG: 1-acyl-sn-glycerol-3-phosphate acyltransferase [Pseudomonadales bacterium]|nr:1-acyl-sn-glycerol-3-phosphate acyltransferase [Pseudomonadales bacterium]
MTIVMATVFILLFPVLSTRIRHKLASLWCNSVLNWLRLTCGVRYEIIGYENIPSEPAVFLANHQSSWETILFYKLVYPVSPILKKELLRIPFWGWSMRLQDPIAIDRSKPREAGKSLLTQGVERIRSGKSVIVFPEGSRSPAGTIKRFSRGGAKLAVAADSPIVPIVHNAGDCWPPRQFIKRPGFIKVIIGEAIATAGCSASDLTEEAEQWIRNRYLENRV